MSAAPPSGSPSGMTVATSAPRRHLVAVWNPAYAAGLDVMDAHVQVLLEAARRGRERDDFDDVFVWWGRIRSANRQQPLPHLGEVLALDDAIEDEDGAETHLYLTDYRSLYVGLVGGVTADDVRATDPANVPAYYTDRGLDCDCWFRLWDLRRLVHDDTLAVVHELQKLRNLHYHERPVSLYGGMVDLPLVVRRDDDARFFDEHERARVLGDELWVEFDARQAGVGAMERELSDNLFGARTWEALDRGTRTFIATAERDLRAHRAVAGYDFAPVLGGLAKALEVELNLRLRRALRHAPAEARRARTDHGTVDLGARHHLTLGQWARVVGGERELNEWLARHVVHGRWFAGELPAFVDAFAEVRNEGAHAAVVDRDTVVRWRDRLVGVGCEGIFAELAKVGGR